jgi:hypothetical protein
MEFRTPIHRRVFILNGLLYLGGHTTCGVYLADDVNWSERREPKICPDPPKAVVDRILAEPRGKPWTPPEGFEPIPIR